MHDATPPQLHGLLAAAQHLLQTDQREHAAACLMAARHLAPADLAAHNLMEEHNLPGALGKPFGVDGIISPQCEIYRFFAAHPTSINPPRDYLSDGWRTLLELTRLCDEMGRPLKNCRSFLEFACGYGRFTRHLVNALPAGALTVSDVMPGSVDFLRQRLGVQGFYSSMQPQECAFAGRYDMIFVLSLFSHLPQSTWQAWLNRLFDALTPGGTLIFTTHGEHAAALAGVSLPHDGLFFVAQSESQALDNEAYGCTYVSPGFVLRAISALPGAASVQQKHFPAHFWGSQDAWALGRKSQ